MGRFWKSDDEIFSYGDLVADRLAGLANKEGIAYGPDAVNAMRMALHENARDFLGLDPQKILDELDRMQKAAREVGVDLSETVTVELGAAKDHLRDWHGDGADAFRQQVDRLRAFTGVQAEAIAKCVTALGALLRVAVQSREDFVALAQATADQVDKVFKETEDAGTEFVLKIGNGIAKTVLGAIEDPAKVLFATAENVMDIAVEGVTLALRGGKLGEIVTDYAKQRDRLLGGYETELRQIAELLARAQDWESTRKTDLFEPLPMNLNVNSPDFRYERFMSKDQGPGLFGQRVEAERQKYVAERQSRLFNPDSPIQQRLAGN